MSEDSVSVKGPYPSIGKEIGHSIRGPTTRHYASGKPDDETIEANCKGFNYRNHQFIVYVTMHETEHDDNISLKLGGTHMGSGWFDQGVSFEAGKVCFGKEEKHPSTQTCVIKGPSIGSVIEKKVGVCATYYADENFCELFTDTGTGWVKQLEAKDIGGFNPGADKFEAQLRIDGFAKGSIPTIHNAVVQPIAPRGEGPSPTPSPTPSPGPSPGPAPAPVPVPVPAPISKRKFIAVATGKKGRRWKVKSGDNEWFAGPDYKFEGKLARDVYPINALDNAPVGGKIKEGGWGANTDAKTWKIVNMKDNPALFKVVDAAGKNVITDFVTEIDAQKYIDYQKFVGGGGSTAPPESPSPTPSPAPAPGPSPVPPTNGAIIEDGVKMFHQKIGEPVTFKYKSSNPGRAQFVAELPKGFINLEVTGYLNIKGVSNKGEEVSIKTRGGPHSDGKNQMGSCYISGIGYDGSINNQYEEPHPSNHSMSLHGKAGKFDPGNIIGKWFGMKNIVYFNGTEDVIQLYLDTDGLDEAGKPKNNWRLFWETTSKQFAGKQNGANEPKTYFRLDDIEGDPEKNVEFKFGTVREIVPPT